MIRIKDVLLIVLMGMLNFSVFAQMDESTNSEALSSDYSDCAAIFFNGNLLVDSYSPDGKCKMEETDKGQLTLSTVSLSEEGALPTGHISFRVAIRHGESNTLFLLTAESVKKVSLEDILKECRQGDNIIILTDNKKFTLPHHEIEILWK